MLKRTALAAAIAALPVPGIAHPSGHGGLSLSEIGSHLASDPVHLLALGGVAGAGLLAVAAAAIRSARARRRSGHHR